MIPVLVETASDFEIKSLKHQRIKAIKGITIMTPDLYKLISDALTDLEESSKP